MNRLLSVKNAAAYCQNLPVNYFRNQIKPIFYSSWGTETLKPAERLGSSEKRYKTVVPRHTQLVLK